ncbi:MAG: HepT-like ribonuclease domain-containing protein [Burkholderiales bacterium]
MSRDWRLYVDDIRTSCKKILRYVDGVNFAEFKADEKTYDAVLRNLEIIGEAAKHIPGEGRALSPDTAWRKIAGFRDVVAHA